MAPRSSSISDDGRRPASLGGGAADQILALHLFVRLGDVRAFAFCRVHARMIARFGRFPHRNALLGRKSSPAEKRAVAAGNAW